MKLDEANRVILVPAQEADLADFQLSLQDAFAAGFAAAFGTMPEGPIPSDAELGEFFHAPGAVTYHILLDGVRDEVSVDVVVPAPGEHGVAGELGAVVGNNHPRLGIEVSGIARSPRWTPEAQEQWPIWRAG